jgi:hypothetical protein
MSLAIAAFARPFIVLLIFGVFALGIRWAINRWMPEGWLKTQILKHRGGKKDSLCR